jgi:hypothetical protein
MSKEKIDNGIQVNDKNNKILKKTGNQFEQNYFKVIIFIYFIKFIADREGRE